MKRARLPARLSATGAGLFAALLPGLAAAAPASADDIRDIRPLILIAPWWHWLVVALPVVAVVALLAVGLRYWQRRSRRPLTARERALAALSRAEDLARAGQCRKWAETVATALREALTARLGLDACPQTTHELASVDWSAWPSGAAVDGAGLSTLLSTLDLTRFALGRLELAGLLATTNAARDWVEHLFLPLAQETSKPLPSATQARTTVRPADAAPVEP